MDGWIALTDKSYVPVYRPPPEYVTSFDGTHIAVRTYGDRSHPALVLLNGVGCTEVFWDAVIRGLGERMFIIEPEYRGHYDSGSAPNPDAYRVEDHATDIERVLAHLEIDRAVFLGFSLGVLVALECHRRAPERAAALVLVSGTFEDPLATIGGLLGVRPLLTGMFDLARRVPRVTGAVLQVCMTGRVALPVGRALGFIERDAPREACERYLGKVTTIDPQPYMATLRLLGEYSGREVLPRISAPTLIMAGESDTMSPLPIMREMHRAIRGSEFRSWPNGTHTLLITRGERITREIEQFLERHRRLDP